MTNGRRPDELLREIGRLPIPVEDAEVKSARRERVVGRIAMTVRKSQDQARVRRFRRLFAWIAAAALVLLLIGAGLRSRHRTPSAGVASLSAGAGPVMLSHAGKTDVATVERAAELGVGDGVSTLADSRADLRLLSGVEITVRPSTRIAIERADTRTEIVSLALGEVSVRVPHLGPGRSFAVRTPDAKVVVHGTAFVVRVESTPGGTVTRVEVSEGKVSVERGTEAATLQAGDVWPPHAKPETKPAPAPAVPAQATGAEEAAATAKPANLNPSSASALAEQNRLFAAAAKARRKGDDRSAVAALSQLISRHPDSVLVPEARVERFRALKRLGRDAEAAREARKYLVEQRDGAARDEARGLVLEQKP